MTNQNAFSSRRRTRISKRKLKHEILEDRRLLAAIAGHVFEDLDTDFMEDPSEPRLNGVTVQLTDEAGNNVAQAVTGDFDIDGDGTISPLSESGIYRFIDLRPGTYFVAPLPGPPIAPLNTPFEVSIQAEVVSAVSTIQLTDDLGLIEAIFPELGLGITYESSLHGFSFNDANFDGTFNSGSETGQEGVSFRLTGTDILGNEYDQVAVTDESGEFAFEGLLPSIEELGFGSGYTVTQVVPDGSITSTTPLERRFDLRRREEIVWQSGAAGLAADDPRFEIVAGTDLIWGTAASGSIGGFKFNDVDGDGTFDAAGDAPLAGVTFRLTGIDGQGNGVEITTVTDENGSFSFSGLAPSVAGEGLGTGYTITEIPPSNSAVTTPFAQTFDLRSGENLDNAFSIGNTILASFHGFAFEDANFNGVFDTDESPLSGVSYQLSGVNALGNNVVEIAVTDANGEFAFDNLLPSVAGEGGGTGYTIEQVVSNLSFVPGAVRTFDLPSGQELVWQDGAAMLSEGDARVEVLADFNGDGVTGDGLMWGNVFAGSIHGFKFNDINGNGIFEPGDGDTPQANVEFQLTGTEGDGFVTTLTTVTDANGEFEFVGLFPSVAGEGLGTGYTLTEILPDLSLATTPTVRTFNVESGQEFAWQTGAAGIPGPATPAVDQSHRQDGMQPNVLAPTQLLAQTFTPSVTGNLVQVEIQVDSDASGEVRMEIRTVNADGQPTQNVLASQTIGAGNLPVGDDQILTFDFSSSPAVLVADVQYAIVIASSSSVKVLDWDTTTENTYALGSSFTGNGLIPWTQLAGDAWFSTTMQNAADPREEVLADTNGDGTGDALIFGTTVQTSIHGFAFEDSDFDGVFDEGGDVGRGNVSYQLTGTDGLGNIVDQTADTNANGEFVFENLFPSVEGVGTSTGYTVTVVLPDGFTASTPLTRSFDLTSGQEIVWRDGAAMLPDGDPRTEVLADSDQDGTGDLLIWGMSAAGSISGVKFEDIHADGVRDSGVDEPLADVSFRITGTDGQGNVVDTTATTNDEGVFTFPGLLPSVPGEGAGTGYSISEIVDNDLVPTTATSGTVNLLSGQTLTEALVVGNTFNTSIHGFFFEDMDFDGVFESGTDGGQAGTTFRLTGTDGLGNVYDQTAVTDETGNFAFTDLLPSVSGQGGTGYTVTQILPDGFVASTPIVRMFNLTSRQEVVWQDGAAALPADDPRTEVLVGDQLIWGASQPGSISVFKFEDVDGDGIFETAQGDTPLPGVSIRLTGTDGQGNEYNVTAISDADGQATFTELLPSVAGEGAGTDYTVVEVDTPGSEPTTPITLTTSLLSGQNVEGTLAIGNAFFGSLHGVKFEDSDFDGAFDVGNESGQAGVTFQLTGTDSAGNNVDAVAVTNFAGEFSFENLAPSVAGEGTGTGYTLTEIVPSGFTASTPIVRNFDLRSGQELVWRTGAATLPQGDPRTEFLVGSDLIFGNVANGSVHGFKFEDVNANGIYEPNLGDVPLAGVRFQLTGLGGPDGLGFSYSEQAVSDANGEFQFVNVPPSVAGEGTGSGYTLVESVPAEAIATTVESRTFNLFSGQELAWQSGAANLPSTPSLQVDVNQTVTNGSSISFGANRVVAQTFQPGVTGQLAEVQIVVDATSQPLLSDLILEIQTVDDQDTPSGSVLGTSTISVNEFNVSGLEQTISFELGTSIDAPTLFANERYALVFRSAAALPFIVRTSVANEVTGGTFLSTDAGASFDQIVGDMTFSTVMQPTADARTEVVVGDELVFGNAFLGSISGIKFEDGNFDGVRLPRIESPLPGVTFRLTGTDGLGQFYDEIVVTDALGAFQFDGLVPSVSADGSGTGYTLTEIAPDGSLLTTDNNGLVVDVVSGQNLDTLQNGDLVFGNTFLGSVHGFKYNDVNGNGVFEPNLNDAPEAGVAFTLTGSGGVGENSFDVNRTVFSDANGEFWFDDLPPNVQGEGNGTGYTLTEIVPEGQVPTTPIRQQFDLASGQALVWQTGAAMLPAAPQPTADQSHRQGDGVHQLHPTESLAQTFTAGVTGSLTQVQIRGDILTSAAITMAIQTVDSSGQPSGTALATVTRTAEQNTVGEDQLLTFNFSADPPSLVAGFQYAIVVSSSTTERVLDWDATNTDTYDAGGSFSRTSGSAWFELTGDAYFATTVAATADARTEVDAADNLTFGNTLRTSIHGLAFTDDDFDSDFESGESGLSGVTFRLTGTDGLGNTYDEITLTNINGEFAFDRLLPSVDGEGPGTGYTVTQVVPDGFTASTPITRSFDLRGGEEIVWRSGAAELPIDDGRFEVLVGNSLIWGASEAGSIDGFKFEDINGNRLYEPAIDSPLEGVSFRITGTDGQGNVVNRTVVTGADGTFEFIDLLPSVDGEGAGTGYSVVETIPAGFIATTASSLSTNLTSGQNLENALFVGNTVNTSIHGLFFEDMDFDGVFESATEGGRAGTTFRLTGTDGLGNVYDQTAITDGNGNFAFTDLLPSVSGQGGTGYTVTQILPDGFVASTPVVRSFNLTSRQEVVWQDGAAALPADDPRTEVLVGDQLIWGASQPGSISVFKFEDVDGDGIFETAQGDTPLPGVSIRLTGTDGQGNEYNVTAISDADGQATFTDLLPSVNGEGAGTDFTVVEVVAPGSEPTTPVILTTSLLSGQNVEGTLVIGNAFFGSLHGVKFEDSDFDGDFDLGSEPGQAGVTFRLTGTDSAGNEIDLVTVTNGEGEFSFENLVPSVAGEGTGTGYTLTEIVPPGFLPSTTTVRSFDLRSGQELVWRAGAATLPLGDPREEFVVGSELMFGNYANGSVHGFKFEDVNANGIYEPDLGDSALAGVEFRLIGQGGPEGFNFSYNESVVTDENGGFSFVNVPPSVQSESFLANGYILAEIQPDGTTVTTGSSRLFNLFSGQELVWQSGAANLPSQTSLQFDVEQTLTDGSSISFGGNRVIAQTFQPSVTGQLAQVRIVVDASSQPVTSDLVLELHSLNSQNQPSGNVIASTTIAAGDLDISGLEQTIRFDLNTSIEAPTLFADQGYAFVLRSLTPLPFIVRSSLTNQVNGSTFLSTDNGTSYEQIVGDVAFRTVVLPSADPRAEVVVGDELVFGNAFNGSIHGFKFEDADFDGVFDANESPLAGVTFRLTGTDGQGRVRDELAVSDENGMFSFEGLVPSVSADGSGTGYTITEVVPAGSALSTANNSLTHDLSSGQAIVWQTGAAGLADTDPRSEVVAGSSQLTFGNSVLGSIHGFKFNDANANGQFEPNLSETRQIGVAFTLTGTGGVGENAFSIERTLFSNGNGEFAFENLLPGTYVVTEAVPDNFLATRPVRQQFVLTSGQALVWQNGAASLPGVSNPTIDQQQMLDDGADLGASSTQSAAQTFIPGQTGALTQVGISVNSTGAGELTLSLVTVDGVTGQPTSNSLATAVPTGTIPVGEAVPVVFDFPANAPMLLQGTQYALVLSNANAATEGWRATNDNFQYAGGQSFINSGDGWIAVPGDAVFTTTMQAATDGRTEVVTTDLLFGNTISSSIHGFKFEDLDGDGLYDPDQGETPMANVAFRLTGQDINGNSIVRVANTDETGQFRFEDLLPSSNSGALGYTISELSSEFGFVLVASRNIDVGSGQALVWQNGAANLPLNDPRAEVLADADGNGTGERLMWGNVALGSLHGRKFDDVDGDGQRDGEPGLANVTFNLTGIDALGNAVTRTTTTDSNGEFSFTNLYPSVAGEGQGTGYTITEVVPNLSVPTTPVSRTFDVFSGAQYVWQDGLVALPAAPVPQTDVQRVLVDGSSLGVSSEQVVAQAFEPGITGTLTQVDIVIDYIAETPLNDLTLEIQTVNLPGAEPSGAVIASVTIPAEQIPVGALQRASFVFDSDFTGRGPTLLEANAYALVLKWNGDPGDLTWQGFASTTGGGALVTSDGGRIWDVSGVNANFATEMLPADDPRFEVNLGTDLIWGNTLTGSIHGFKFEDVDADGVYDPALGDIPAPNVTFNLSGTDNFGNFISRTTTTDANGEFEFILLPPSVLGEGGTGYEVTEVTPFGFEQTTQFADGILSPLVTVHGAKRTYNITPGQELVWQVGAADLPAGDRRVEVLLDADQDGIGQELIWGNTARGSITGNKFEDVNRNGIYEPNLGDLRLANVEFRLTGVDGQGNTITRVAFSDVNGRFTFDDLLPSVAGSGPGTGYTVTEIVPRLYINTTPIEQRVDLRSGEDRDNLLWGNAPLPGSINGHKFEDADGDGQEDPGEARLNGWTITLTDLNGNQVIDAFGQPVLDQTTSSVDINGDGVISSSETGLYSFTDLLPGSYLVREVQQAGFTQTTLDPQFITITTGQIYTARPDQIDFSQIGDREIIVDRSLAFGNQLRGEINWRKEDKNGELLGGVIFTLTQTHTFNRSTGEFTDIIDRPIVVQDNVLPDTDIRFGLFNVNDLELGRYTLRETFPVPGYDPDETVETIEVTGDNPFVTVPYVWVNLWSKRAFVGSTYAARQEYLESIGLTLNEQPVAAVSDSVIVPANASRFALSLMENDFSQDGNELNIIDVGTPDGGGTAELIDGQVYYTPPANPSAWSLDTFTYTISDGVATETATVTPIIDGSMLIDDSNGNDPGGNDPGDSMIDDIAANGRLDVNNDGFISPIDALLVINQLNAGVENGWDAGLDTNEDGSLSPIDALLVINRLNERTAQATSAFVPFEAEDDDDENENVVDQVFGDLGDQSI